MGRNGEKDAKVDRGRGWIQSLEVYLFNLEQHEKKETENMTSEEKREKQKKAEVGDTELGQRLRPNSCRCTCDKWLSMGVHICNISSFLLLLPSFACTCQE